MRRLAIGTVQFGLSYGVANRMGQVSGDEVRRILDRAMAAGVDTLDTAIAYGDSESVLGRAGIGHWRVITKLPPLPDDVVDVPAWVAGQLESSLGRLRVTSVDALLLHRPADLLGAHGPVYQAALRSVVDRGLARATGISIYDPAELDALWPSFRPQVVQAPFNVFDRRLAQSGWLERLSAAGVRVHVRSVFLQGLLLMEPAARPAHFTPWNALLDRWSEWCRDRGVERRAAAIAFVDSHPAIERYVVGLDSLEQLEQLLATRPDSVPDVPAEFASPDLSLIEPSRWRLN